LGKSPAKSTHSQHLVKPLHAPQQLVKRFVMLALPQGNPVARTTFAGIVGGLELNRFRAGF